MKNIIYIAIGFAIAALIYTERGKRLAKKFNKKTSQPKEFTLKKGDSGERVKKLQSALNYHAPDEDMRVNLSGEFDEETEELAFTVTGKKEIDEKVYRNLTEIYNNRKKPS